MKNKKILFLIPALLILSACATTHHSEGKITEQAKLEAPTHDSMETKDLLIDILSKDSTVLDSERKQIVDILNERYRKYKEIEVLTNQKKVLLIREYVKAKPDHSKIHAIQNAIKKNYTKKSEIMMACFDEISKTLKLHPKSASAFFERASSFWPIRDRAP